MSEDPSPRLVEERDRLVVANKKKPKKIQPKRVAINADNYASFDKEVIKSLQLIEKLMPEIIELYTTAVEIAEIAPSSTQYGEQVSTSSGHSDPVGDMAVDPRRSQRTHQIKEARRHAKAALQSAKDALYWSAAASG